VHVNASTYRLTGLIFAAALAVIAGCCLNKTMSAAQQFCLRWNNHQPNFVTVFSSLLHSQVLTDVTLAADGQQIEAHKLVLSACSTYFQVIITPDRAPNAAKLTNWIN
jgi:BTB/POZ domain